MVKAKPFATLPATLTRIEKEIIAGTSNLIRKALIAAGRAATMSTAVDTGKARSNMRGSLNTPARGVIPPYFAGNRLGINEQANDIAAQAQQQIVFKTFDVRKNKSGFITNNVEYIGVINNGGPRIAPHDMAAKGRQAAVLVAKTTRILGKC